MLKGILNAVIMLVSLFLCIGFVAVIHLTDSIVFIVLGVLGFAIFFFSIFGHFICISVTLAHSIIQKSLMMTG
ncbi:hypothetical protein [Secundilactobacillus kimchicus]|uniref:hypothetical protein n=1 Tax=Secundilactobacillus kimchicus TaxID=528209 RepID=UPI0006D24669|nr:hypothetical protein [Secundilactobacillus kimchicus]